MRTVLSVFVGGLLLAAGYAAGIRYPEIADRLRISAYLQLEENTSRRPEISETLENSTSPEPEPNIQVDADEREVRFSVDGRFIQGGFARGKIPNNRPVFTSGRQIAQTSTGAFFYGIGRNDTGAISFESAPEPSVVLEIGEREYSKGQIISTTRSLAQDNSLITGHDDLFPEVGSATRSIGGTSRTERLSEENTRKANALQSRADIDGLMQDWIYPIAGDWRVSSPWGASRIKNGQEKVHYGLDMAAPEGTPLLAPADGIVTLADDNFFYEGGLVFIDHGLGLTSIYLHMSEVSVLEGELVQQGQSIGKVGATGSATGPHVCWRLYFGGRKTKIDPETLVTTELEQADP